jgi:transcriptional regulator
MYIPSAFAITDPVKIAEVISAHSFGMMISKDGDSLFASHLPFLYQPESGPHGLLRSHMAKANRHWKLFNEQEEALVIFNGPHSYISPNWYTTQVAVPTWNYVTVHAYGKARILTSDADLTAILVETVDKHESGLPEPWTTSHVPTEMEAKLHLALVGFEVEITRIEGKFKLGQNRSQEDREKMLSVLQASGDSESRALAEYMERELKGET